MENHQLPASLKATLDAAAARLHVSPALALHMAVNRLALSTGLMPEGDDLAKVDMSQSLPAEAAGPGAVSVSLPGCEDA